VSGNCGDPPRRGRGEARYANYFEVGVNQEEIVIDLGQAYGEGEPVSFHTRIVTSPAYARELAELLDRAVGRHPAGPGPE
jgi:hypothetical protein